ncbi:MAG: MFS transporter [Rickettsiaceae bacterium]|nr:MFS transporter [Rickettsiaceae bacterium]
MYSYIKPNDRIRYSIIIANSLDHYDAALYAFMLPIILNLFVSSNIDLAFMGLLSGGLLMRPMAAIVCRKLITLYPQYKLLRMSLIGCSFATFCMGLLPIESMASTNLFCYLFLLRILQSFFSALESSIADIYLMQISRKEHYASIGGCYYAGTLAGYIFASLIASFVATSSSPYLYWRLAFLLGIIPGLIGLTLRFSTVENKNTRNLAQDNENVTSIFTSLWKNRIKLLRIFCAKGISGLTYYFVFVFHLKFIPEATAISKPEIYSWNFILLIIDMILLIFMGKLCDKFNLKNWLIFHCIFIGMAIVPYYYFLIDDTFMNLVISDLILVVAAVGFSSGVMPWLMQETKNCEDKDKYLLINFGGFLGTEVLGRLTPGICMALYHYSNNSIIPGLYFLFILVCATCCAFYGATEYKKSEQTYVYR